MFGWFWRLRATERDNEMLWKAVAHLEERIDSLRDNTKEIDARRRDDTKRFDDRLDGHDKRLNNVGQHLNRLYANRHAAQIRSEMENPEFVEEPVSEVSPEEAARREEMLKRIMDDPAYFEPFNFDDMVHETAGSDGEARRPENAG